MLTTFFNLILLYSLAVWNFAAVSSQELPTDLRDSNWKYNSEEGNGFIIFYAKNMVENGIQWNLVSLTGNFMSFQRINKVTTDTGEKFLYKCWLYKRVKSTLYYFYPMTGIFKNQRAHVSADDPLDVCDYCTNTEAKLHILYRAETSCECTPECSQLTIYNTCTRANHDTSSTNCVNGTTATTAEAPYDPITSTKPTTSRPDETNEETSTNHKKSISALDRLGLNEDAFVGVVSGSLLFVYLVVAIVGCACCVFILGRRRNRKRKEKESQENLVPERANYFQNKSYLDSLPQVFHRIDE
uniref:Uncharacterized protein n=1 Tax=Magallana gigas TaxID=29159 RepID=A0A8W8KZD4_MAGGI